MYQERASRTNREIEDVTEVTADNTTTSEVVAQVDEVVEVAVSDIDAILDEITDEWESRNIDEAKVVLSYVQQGGQ